MEDNKNKSKGSTTEQKIDYLNVLIQEYIHRDTHMWSQNFRFFFASLVIMILPSVTERFGIEIPELFNSVELIFPVFGIILAFLFLYVSLSQAKRFKAVSKLYDNIVKSLPDDLKRIPLREIDNCKFLNKSNAYLLPALMFSGLIILGILMVVDFFV